MRKKILVVAAALTMGIVEAKPILIPVIGTGVVQDADRGTAASQATDAALQNLSDSCAGSVMNVIKIPPICFGGGDDNPYTCTVVVKATCRIGS
jgi:hypothetical protein